MQGKLVAIEGIDGSGKTAVCDQLEKKLTKQGYNCIIFREPTEVSFWGVELKKFLNGSLNLTNKEATSYFLLDRVFDVNYRIIPALKRGNVVIMDRYYYSTAAYQGDKKMFPSTIATLSVNHLACPIPDVTIWLKLDPRIAYERVIARKQNKSFYETENMMRRIITGYEQVFTSMFSSEPIIEIDASKDLNIVVNEILTKIKQYLVVD